ncbi:cleft lip and palate transmembrane 1 [Gloeophyllum trabeum ATCC 11539]|uniref:Cleft lip and palate transmembrane 1 n=1 Tax=Gloeophyllum trabeum (strain ATCC 11539 / FP-39264 / Madison 617) TaxID=670483 RepID=S7QIF5_GLOTA|nr:cleft lip and palate transmembrane 1 [Gloeophyllum trabeum ATCC 11539]EPQ59002.1 cleft lip and palate transmembrane 1 [Gloeophyllum trabeum ATCC 11539]
MCLTSTWCAATKFISSRLTPSASPPTPSSVVPDSNTDTPARQVSPFHLPPVQAYLDPSWPLGTPISMHVYLSTSPTGDVFSSKWTSGYRADRDEGLPNFVWENITFGDWKEERKVEFEVNLPKAVQNNGSMWADIFLVKGGRSPDPSDSAFDPASVHHVRKLLTRYMPKLKVRKQRNLLADKDGGPEKEEEEVSILTWPQADIIVSHWHPNLTLALVSDAPTLPYGQLPPVLSEHVHLVPGLRDDTGTKGFYKPIVFANDFWHLRSQYVEINSTTPTLPLQVVFQPMSYFKFQLFASMTHGFNEAAKQQGAGAGAELDEVKRMLVETNPYFLALTGIVSLLHTVFEMLAFKNDVSHWRKKQELVGVSIVANVVVQLIILLYLLDNNEQTSWMILFGQGMGLLIEAWKITKAVDIKLVAAPAGSLFPYKIEVHDKHVLSEDEKRTQEYDKLAYRYVSYAAIPLLAAYTVYSLLYESHRGWYSFVISTLTSFVYMFGFAQLIPQLIINYKLKSVAHMPMKAMIYKTLSTVVDDLFAFCIKMPFLHRLACFRDDLVFLVFLYQRWIYRIDPKRINEYGQVMEGEDAGEEQQLAIETKKTK